MNWLTLLAVGMDATDFLCHERTVIVVLRLLLGFGWSHTGLVVWGALLAGRAQVDMAVKKR